MQEGSWGKVVVRASVAGMVMGALAGALLAVDFAAYSTGEPLYTGFPELAVIMGAIGAVFGLICAVPAGLVLAASHRFLARHLYLARVYGGVVGGLLLASLAALCSGLRVSGPGANGWLTVGALALGIGVGGLSTKFVVTGQRCLIARWIPCSSSIA